jgi:hypothetical protein
VPVIALAAAAAVLCAAPEPFFWPRPDVVEEIDIPDVIKADGVPVRLHVLRSKLGVQQLLERFANAFVQAGFWVPRVQKRLLAEPHVTGLDWRGLVSYSAVLSPNPDGTTTCLLGEAQLGKRETPAAVPDFAPLFPAARDVMRVEEEGARIISYAVRGPTTEEVTRFYADQLPRAGFKAAEGEGAWEKPGAQLQVSARPAGDGAVSVVLVQSRR